MNIRKTYWIASLSLLLSFSLALPYCCHADISELFSHHQEMSADMMSGHHDDTQRCDCGHEFVKDFQKTKKVITGQNVLPQLTVVSTQEFTIGLFDQHRLHFIAAQPGIWAATGPPLHILNSVFLN